MAEGKKELQDGELEGVGGGAAVVCGKRVTTAISPKCNQYGYGSNTYNIKMLTIRGTCGRCKHMQQ